MTNDPHPATPPAAKGGTTHAEWEIGYGNGVTGPTAPRAGGATCSEAVAADEGLDYTPSVLVTVRDIPQGAQLYNSVVAIFPQRGEGEADANARLFLAARDLLAAAKLVAAYEADAMNECDAECRCAFCHLRAAIAKATEGE